MENIRHSNSSCPGSSNLYALRRGLGYWELTFAGRPAVFKHEQGAHYAAYLLLNPPPAPIHGIRLALQVRDGSPAGGVLCEVIDPATSRAITLSHGDVLEQRSLALDQAEAMGRVRRRRRELEAVLEDENEIEPVKNEVRRELEQLAAYESTSDWRTRDAAQKMADAVGKALKRFHQHLAAAQNAQGDPHPVLRAFAEHLRLHLLVPSGRGCSHGGFRERREYGGCFTYLPPDGVAWRG